jgi:hypothetical protein
MGHESRIELWSPHLTTFCFAGFGTERLRRKEAMKTADSENPNRGVAWPRNRAYGAVGQNQSRSIEWAEKQEKFRPKEMCFFLTSPFIELTRAWTETGLEALKARQLKFMLVDQREYNSLLYEVANALIFPSVYARGGSCWLNGNSGGTSGNK